MPARRGAALAAAWVLLLAPARFALAVDFVKQERSEYEVKLLAKTLQQVLEKGNFTTIDAKPLQELSQYGTIAVAGNSKACPDYWSNLTGHVSCMLKDLGDEDVCPQSWTGWVICTVEMFFNVVFSKLVFSQSAFWFAFILLTLMNIFSQTDEVAKFVTNAAPRYVRDCANFYRDWILPWRALVSGVVILNIFQADWTAKSTHMIGRLAAKNPVWTSIVFILFEKLISSWTTVFITKGSEATCLHDIRENLLTDDLRTEKVTNRYQELTYSFCKLICLFLVQCSLLMFYLLNLHESSELTDQGTVSCFKWLIGVGVVVVVGDDELGQRFNIPLWFALNRHTAAERKLRRLNIEIKLRAFMSFVVNSAGLTFLRRTFPVILAVSGPWDFIMDCMAIFFIVKLDDHDLNRTVDKELWKKKWPKRPESEYTELANMEEATDLPAA